MSAAACLVTGCPSATPLNAPPLQSLLARPPGDQVAARWRLVPAAGTCTGGCVGREAGGCSSWCVGSSEVWPQHLVHNTSSKASPSQLCPANPPGCLPDLGAGWIQGGGRQHEQALQQRQPPPSRWSCSEDHRWNAACYAGQQFRFVIPGWTIRQRPPRARLKMIAP